MEALARSIYRLVRDAFRYAIFGYSHRRGVFRTFAEAEAAARGHRIGYNHPDLAREYGDNLSPRLDSTEYPVLFHLARIVKAQCTILDFGGNVGTHYLRYRRYLDSARARWVVCDLPEITKVGQDSCNGMAGIAFVNDVAEVTAPIDIVLACDSLQYAGIASPDILLRNLAAKGHNPAHILFDQLPLHGGERFVTLQNGGLVRYPHHVYNRDEFIAAVSGLGYDLVDSWQSHCDPCLIPFHPEKSVRAATGLFFCRRA